MGASAQLRRLSAGVLLASLVACAHLDPRRVLEAHDLAPLPRPVTNNAVAVINNGSGSYLFSLMGIGAGLQASDITSAAYWLRVGSPHWEALRDVPGAQGRIAATAVGLNGRVFVFGGYTVAADGTEHTFPGGFSLDPLSGGYQPLAHMPVPVDDSMSVSYGGRYVYLVSGWHEDGNVDNVQVYDSVLDRWTQSSPYPGPAVFGQAGAIVANHIVIADGVRVEAAAAHKRRFHASDACYVGTIDPAHPRQISWRRIPPHPGLPLYRMAATGIRVDGHDLVVFAGGSSNPYNYNGVGYDGELSPPSDRVFAYDLTADAWRELGSLPVATMDLRGLLRTPDGLVIVGGMHAGAKVTTRVISFKLPRPVFSRHLSRRSAEKPSSLR